VSRTEVEVKLKVGDVSGIPSRMAGIGARLLYPREFEDNHLYDFPDRGLLRRGALLRIRTTERATFLTYKDRPRADRGAKVREEAESRLAPSEGATLAEIMRGLGLEVVFRYQKYRTTWQVRDLLATLDETPIGVFLELEGSHDAIDRVSASLGYSGSDYIAQSYRDLYLASLGGAQAHVDRMVFTDRDVERG
jgi:adenylate cyclase class 2